MTDIVLRKTMFLRADLEETWAWLTEPDKLAIWFHRPDMALTEGASFSMIGADSGKRLCWGNVKRAKRPTYLEYSFGAGPMGDAQTRVVWHLAAVPGGTQISLEHSGLPQGEAAFGLTLAFDKGWDEHLARMRGAAHDTEAA